MSKFKKKGIILPNYDKSILSTITSILKYYGIDNGHVGLSSLDKKLKEKYKNVVLLVLDGLGSHILDGFDKEGFFKKNQLDTVTSVYPSTTTAAMTPSYPSSF